jgi:diacylglycerol kinase (ATP)
MQRRVLYFINPISGTRGKEQVLAQIRAKSQQYGVPYEIMDTVASGRYDFLREKITAEHITDIVIAGGDGTVNQVVLAVKSLPVQIGIIPCGSGNGLALTAKIPKRPDKALDVFFTGKASPVDGFFINDRFACMLCGLGLDAQVAHDFARQSARGLATYVRESLKDYVKAKAYPFTVSFGAERFDTDAFFISIANSNQFGNQVTIAPRARLNDGLLDIVVVKKMNKLLLPFALLRQLKMSRPISSPGQVYKSSSILYFQTDALTIQNTGGAPLHIDGDPANTASVFDIKVERDCFWLIQPG